MIETNEYGIELDRNGYAPSLLQEDDKCFLCGKNLWEHLDRNEIFNGCYRSKSKRLGLWVLLHHDTCHENGKNSFHRNRDVALRLKKQAQIKCMETYGWTEEQFIREFDKSYLWVTDYDD